MKKQELKTQTLTSIEEAEQPVMPGLVNEPEVEYGEKLPPDHLDPEQLERLRESLRQLDAGLGIPHSEVMKEMRSWFKK